MYRKGRDALSNVAVALFAEKQIPGKKEAFRKELGRKTRVCLERIDGSPGDFACGRGSTEVERNKGKYQRFAVHDQKLGVLWMTKDHITFPS